MKEFLMALTEAFIFQCTVLVDSESHGTIIVRRVDYPDSGMPARELKILTNPPEFRKMAVANGELAFYYVISTKNA